MSEPLTRKQIVKLVEMFVGIDGEVFAYDLLTHDAALRARIEQDQGLVAKINELTNDLNRVKQERDEFLEGQRKLEAFVATTLARVRELEEFIDVHRDDSPTYKDIAALTAQNAQERFAEYETQLAALTQAHQQAVEALSRLERCSQEYLDCNGLVGSNNLIDSMIDARKFLATHKEKGSELVEHECLFASACCAAETPMMEHLLCPDCKEHTSFECECGKVYIP